MRADMPWQGYPRDVAPNLTRLARESVVYPRAYAASSYTARSVAALLSGKFPSQLYRNGSFFAEYSKENEFFPERLQANGVRTLAGHAHFYFDPSRGKNLDQGFDVWRLVPDLKVNNTTDVSITGDKHTDLAIAMLSESANTSGPFFLWLHYMDPHDQYRVHPESPRFGSRARDLYDGEIFYTDLQVERLLAFARTQPWWDNTAIIVSADHGEAFGEHRMFRHAFALWEVLTRVPLFIKAPGAAPKVIEARRSDIDLAPTILDLLGVPATPEHVGRTLVPEVYGLEPPGDREPIVTDLPADSNNPPTRAIVKGDHKLIVGGEGESLALYDLAKDPGEFSNLAADRAHAVVRAELKRLFDETWRRLTRVNPYGGGKLTGGGFATGPKGPTTPERAPGSTATETETLPAPRPAESL
ncbi:MAG: sulfatase [Deltaproteobacteria bacterium]|nr:sulfatase [Deltaproteobacteria bacterium]